MPTSVVNKPYFGPPKPSLRQYAVEFINTPNTITYDDFNRSFRATADGLQNASYTNVKFSNITGNYVTYSFSTQTINKLDYSRFLFGFIRASQIASISSTDLAGATNHIIGYFYVDIDSSPNNIKFVQDNTTINIPTSLNLADMKNYYISMGWNRDAQLFKVWIHDTTKTLLFEGAATNYKYLLNDDYYSFCAINAIPSLYTFNIQIMDITNSPDISRFEYIESSVMRHNHSINEIMEIKTNNLQQNDFLKYNYALKAFVNEPFVTSTYLNDLTDVTITAPVTQQVLKYDGALWVNANEEKIFNDSEFTVQNSILTGKKIKFDASNLTDPITRTIIVPDADVRLPKISLPNTGEFIRYNGLDWVNATTQINDLSDINITGLQNGDILLYNSTSGKFENIPHTLNNLQNVNITSLQTGDTIKYTGANFENTPYKLSALDDTIISSALNNQVLRYNGLVWVNSNETIQFQDNTFRILNNVDNSKRIQFDASQVAVATTRTIHMPDNDVRLPKITAPVIGQYIQWNGADWVNITPQLNNNSDVTLTNPQDNDILKYSGGQFINTTNNLGDLTNVDVAGALNGNILIFEDGQNKWVPYPYLSSENLAPNIIMNFTFNLPFNGTQILDTSGNNLHATTTNIVAGDFVPSLIGEGIALEVGGSNRFAEVPHANIIAANANWNFENNKPFSSSFWIKCRAVPDNGLHYIISKRNNGDNIGWSISQDRGASFNRIIFILRSTTLADRIEIRWDVDPQLELDDNNWHHIVVTKGNSASANAVNLYVDNNVNTFINLVQDNLTGSTITTTPFCIGTLYGATAIDYDGFVDALQIFDVELDSTQINMLYNSGLGKETNFVYTRATTTFKTNEFKLINPNDNTKVLQFNNTAGATGTTRKINTYDLDIHLNQNVSSTSEVAFNSVTLNGANNMRIRNTGTEYVAEKWNGASYDTLYSAF